MASADVTIQLLDGRTVSSEVVETGHGIAYGPLLSPGGYASSIGALMPASGEDADGFFLIVPEGVDAGRVVVRNTINSVGRVAVRSIVVVGQGATVEILYDLNCASGADITDTRVTAAGPNASVSIAELFSGEGTFAVKSLITQDSGSNVETVSVAPGSPLHNHVDYSTRLRGADARSQHSGLFIVSGADRMDYNVRVEHLVPDCRSEVLVKGLATDQACGSFTGLVYVAQDAQHTEAYQQSRNLLLSDGAQILTSPQLEIYADDVKCSHGATVGQQDGDEVYYMRQRGLSEEQARSLQLAGFVGDVISRMGDGEFEEKAQALVSSKIR